MPGFTWSYDREGRYTAAEGVSHDEAQRVNERLDEKSRRRATGMFGSVAATGRDFLAMLRDRRFALSQRLKIFALLAILYVISPIDIIPDILVPFGVIDDMSLLAVLGGLIKAEIDRYRIFRRDAGAE